MDKDHNVIIEIGEKSNFIFFIYDIEEKALSYLSPAFEKICGRSRKSIKTAADLIDIIYHEDRSFVFESFSKCKDGHIEGLEFRVIVLDNPPKFLRLCSYSIGKEGKKIVGFAEDVNKEKENENSLRNINSRKNITLEVLSHDLTSPIGLIQGLTKLIEKEIKNNTSLELGKYTEMIQEICRRSIDLIADIVNQEFLESENVTLNRERIELVAKINHVIATFKASEKEIAKIFEIYTSHEKIYGNVDEVKFLQIVTNLISNSIKFTPDNGVIKVSLEQKLKGFLLIIEDNGIGIPEVHQPYLFERFTRASRPGIKGEKSIGLGMSIIKRIVELHHGKIWFESKENEGTTFYIEIPND